MRQFFKALVAILVMVALIGGCAFMFLQDYFVNEAERYSVGMEITHAEESAYYIRNRGLKVKCSFYLRGDDKAIAVNVDEETYAQFALGDWVEVEFRMIENPFTYATEEHAKIIGEMEQGGN